MRDAENWLEEQGVPRSATLKNAEAAWRRVASPYSLREVRDAQRHRRENPVVDPRWVALNSLYEVIDSMHAALDGMHKMIEALHQDITRRD